MARRDNSGSLVCPETKVPLHECELEHAESVISAGAPLASRSRDGAKPAGRTPTVMLREDGMCAYPVVQDIPILLRPEMLFSPKSPRSFDLSDERYAEAYAEMSFYNLAAEEKSHAIASSPPARALRLPREAGPEERASFPQPREVWLDALYDPASQFDAYEHITPIRGKHVLQVGGSGLQAVKFLLAGAAEASVLSPMLGELTVARELARLCGVMERLRCVAGVAEELPFADASFDVAYSGGSVHHMVTHLALPECARVLRPGGRFAAVEPWRAPFYSVGTKIFGKREEKIIGKRGEVKCRPMTQDRTCALFEAFDDAKVIHHGALSRYLLIAIGKLGLQVKLSTVWKINRVDDAICSLVPQLRDTGSSIALLGTRPRLAN